MLSFHVFLNINFSPALNVTSQLSCDRNPEVRTELLLIKRSAYSLIYLLLVVAGSIQAECPSGKIRPTRQLSKVGMRGGELLIGPARGIHNVGGVGALFFWGKIKIITSLGCTPLAELI